MDHPAATHHLGRDAAAVSTRGIERPGHPTIVGSIVGAVGGTVFVLANRGSLPGPWPSVALLAWVVALGTYVWATFLRRRHLAEPVRPHRHAFAIYVASVVAMIAVIQLGARLLAGSGHPLLLPAVICASVGLHFLPFATAFRASAFRLLGWSLAVIGTAGLVLGFVVGPVAASAAAVLGGLVMLALLAWSTRA